jgi:hypothetical protein
MFKTNKPIAAIVRVSFAYPSTSRTPPGFKTSDETHLYFESLDDPDLGNLMRICEGIAQRPERVQPVFERRKVNPENIIDQMAALIQPAATVHEEIEGDVTVAFADAFSGFRKFKDRADFGRQAKSHLKKHFGKMGNPLPEPRKKKK